MKPLVLLAAIAATAVAQTTPVLTQTEIEQLEAKVAKNPEDRQSQQLLGKNYAFFILGVTSLKQYDRVDGVDPAKAASSFAAHARSQLTASSNAGVVAEGGEALWTLSTQVWAYQLTHNVHDETSRDSAQALAAEALDRAVALDPATPNWRTYRISAVAQRVNSKGSLKLGTAEAYAIVKQDLATLKSMDRDNMLTYAAKLAFEAGELNDAKAYAEELLDAAGTGSWNAGNAYYIGNMVLGQVALRGGDRETARSRLLAAGKTRGSPQLNSFGPNMSLAKELIEAGDRPTVLAFFELCRSFWKMDNGNLDRWSAEVTAGKVPSFGPNLLY